MTRTGYCVADCMTTKPVTGDPTMTLQSCAQLMKQHNIGSVIIVENEELIGIVTEDDFVQKAIAEGLALSTPISAIMSTKLVTIAPEQDILVASNLMKQHGIHHLPVISDNRMVGYITMKSLLKIEPELVELLTEHAELRGISPSSPLLENFDQELQQGKCEECEQYSSHLVESPEGLRKCPNCVTQ
jgi:CBS domain-containing protein